MRMRRPATSDVARGVVAGLLATLPMTATLAVFSQLAPIRRRPMLEPRKITNRILAASHLNQTDAVRRHRNGVQVASHFAFGAAAGALYPVTTEMAPMPRWARGAMFGVGTYLASYAGWLPVSGLLAPPQRRPPSRNVALIAAHLCWGVSLDAIYDALGSARGARRQ